MQLQLPDTYRTSNVIDDGYTTLLFIAPEERLHGGLGALFRPMLPARFLEVEELLDTPSGRKGGEARIIGAALAEHILDWTEHEPNGSHAKRPINADTVSRLPYPILKRAHRIVAGVEASDIPPKDFGEIAIGRVLADVRRHQTVTDKQGNSVEASG